MGERARTRAKTKFYCVERTMAKFYFKVERARARQVLQIGTRASFYSMGVNTRARAKFYCMGNRFKFYSMGKELDQGQVPQHGGEGQAGAKFYFVDRAKTKFHCKARAQSKFYSMGRTREEG